LSTIYRNVNKSFAGARWALWLLAISIALAADLARYGGPYYFPIVVITIAVLACGWESHIRNLSRFGTHKGVFFALFALRAVFNLLSLLAWAVPISFVWLMLSPIGSDVSDRVRTGEAVGSAAAIRATISERSIAGQPLEGIGTGLKVARSENVKDGFVSPNGTIYLIIENPPAVAVLTPTLLDKTKGNLQWVCNGYPEKHFWASCRNR
jgi:hypothetical protein